MTTQERKAIVIKSKTEDQTIQGKYIDLHPCVLEHGEKIVLLRNQGKSRYNLNQKEASTAESQNQWYGGYARRDDDICWCIHDKAGRMIGVIRLYNIMHDGSCCNQGSFIIDETHAMSGPYAVETEKITLDFAFDTLRIDKVLNDIRAENKNMNSISRRIGFQFVEDFERDGAKYNLYELTRSNYGRETLEKTLGKWRERE